jgi:hypothetical protein
MTLTKVRAENCGGVGRLDIFPHSHRNNDLKGKCHEIENRYNGFQVKDEEGRVAGAYFFPF